LSIDDLKAVIANAFEGEVTIAEERHLLNA
jgi:hypothetical protein